MGDHGILRMCSVWGGRRLAMVAAILAALALIAANAGSASASPTAPRILLAESQCDSIPPTTLRSQVLAQPGVAAVDLFNGADGTPSVAQLLAYDVVLAMGNCSWADAVAMGNNLADYQDQGGVVVGATFNWQGTGPNSFTLEGRWIDAGYSPYQVGAVDNFSNASLGSRDASNPLLAGVSDLTAFYRDTISLTPGATEIAKWTDGTSAVAFKGPAVGINAYIGDDYGPPVRWSGDFAKIIVNAAPLPSNAFSARLKGRKLIVSVAVPGTVNVTDAATTLSAAAAKKKRKVNLKSSTGSGGPPTISVRLRLTKRAKRKLSQTGRVKVKAKITFTPQRGKANTQTKKLKIKRRRRSR